MIGYLFSRLIRWSAGLLIVAFVSYAMMFYGGGDPIKRMFLDMEAGGVEVGQEVIQAFREKYGLDRPFFQ